MAAEMVSDFEDIEQSLRILFATHPGERVMQPAYGCGLRSLVFEDASEHLLTEIKDMLRRAILFFEPRIDVLKVEAQLVDPLGGHVSISLDYRVRTTNTRHNMVHQPR
jgi:phage baseplate assembly protein W